MTERAPHQKKIRLTTRDVHILEELMNRRTESLGVLHDHFWAPGPSRDSARHRLTRLVAWGFIDKHALQRTRARSSKGSTSQSSDSSGVARPDEAVRGQFPRYLDVTCHNRSMVRRC